MKFKIVFIILLILNSCTYKTVWKSSELIVINKQPIEKHWYGYSTRMSLLINEMPINSDNFELYNYLKFDTIYNVKYRLIHDGLNNIDYMEIMLKDMIFKFYLNYNVNIKGEN